MARWWQGPRGLALGGMAAFGRWSRAWAGGLAMALGCASVAGAHPMPETRIWLDTRPDGLHLSLDIPLNRLEFAFGQPLADEPDQVLARHQAALAAYVRQHLGAWSGDQPWRLDAPILRVQGHDSNAELQVDVTMHEIGRAHV